VYLFEICGFFQQPRQLQSMTERIGSAKKKARCDLFTAGLKIVGV
jgi:hypothetical protein